MSKKTFLQIFSDFDKYCYGRYKKQGYETIIRNFKLHILPYFKDKKICDLKTYDIIKWQDDIMSKKYSNSFNKSLFSAFSTFNNYCIKCNYIKENLVLKVGNFKTKV